MSTNHLDLIARFEGYQAEPYWDYHQWSIGYGSYAGSRDRNQRPNITVSEAEARQMLARQVSTYEANVDRYNSTYNWTPNERAAMISFAYNIGSIDQLTANGTRTKEEIAQAMLLYNKAGGQRLQGLADRRLAERNVFTNGAPIPPAPTGVVGVSGAESEGVTNAERNAVAAHAGDFQAAGNMNDLWSIAEQAGNFWENELDQYDFYTYNLELFVVDQETTSKFLLDDYSLDDIMNDAWPDASTNRVVIAWTGATTEFNIQDLSVESLGYGAGNNARMAGVATHLNFNIVQVGNTSLNDSLQNAAILMGFTSTHDATWYMKIKFLGYENDQPKKLLATKVLPFKISNFFDMTTTTDARGTSTVLEGTIIQNKSFDADINIIQPTFTFKIGETLEETLTNYMEEMNKVIEENNFTGDPKYVNKYTFELAPDFKEQFATSPMNGPTPNLSGASNTPASRQNGLNISEQHAQIPTGSNIYNVLVDICTQATALADLLQAPSDTFSTTFNIVPVLQPEPGGLNIVTNTRGHKVTYHIGIRRTPIVQNQPDLYNKVTNTAKMVDEIFTKGRCRKIYYYQYTGLNDQILEFQVSLNKQLQKAYVSPTDDYVWANFVNANGDSLDSILATNENARGRFDDLSRQSQTLTDGLDRATTEVEGLRTQAEQMGQEIRNSFREELRSQGVDSGIVEQIVNDTTGGRNSPQSILAAIESFDGELASGLVGTATDTNSIGNRIKKLSEDLETAQGALTTAQDRVRANEAALDDVVMQAVAGNQSDRVSEALGRSSEVFGQVNTDGDNLILIEELDTDFVTRLTTEQFDSLIQTMMDNPMTFTRVIIPRLRDRGNTRSNGYWRTTNREGIELARQKYYEGLNVDISMQNLAITIKGDPFWLNNYITPMKATELFGDSATLDQYKNYTVDLNGQNYCMIVNNKAAGTDENDNLKIANLFISVYSVKSITSSFSGGLFTQQLNMVKMPFPSNFKELNPTIDAEFIENEGTSDVPGDDGQGTGNTTSGAGGTGGGGTGTEPGEGAYKVVSGTGQSKRYTVYDANGNVVSEGRGNGPNLPFADEYTQTDETASGGSNPASQIDLGSGTPGGAFSADEANSLLSSDDPFDPRGSRFNTFGDRTGMAPRSVSTEIPANTLTPAEMEQALVIQKEIRRLTTETPLMDMTDAEYARVRQLETALNDIVENSTTGTRGAVRDEIIQREKREELASAQEALAEVEDELDGWYWTQSGREEDEAQREKLRQDVLASQTENAPYAVQEVKTIVNPDTGEREDIPEYVPTSIDKRPIIVPKSDTLPDVYIDNGDGTITVEGPPIQKPTVTDDGLDAIDATSLSEDQKQEYFDALESNNGIKVKQFIDSLPAEQQTEILQLEQTQELVKLPGSSVDMSTPGYENLTESEARQLEAANTVMNNFENQISSLPRVEKSYTFPDGTVDTWTDPDWQQLQPVPYIDADGNVQTFNPIDYFPSDVNDPTYAYSPTVQRRMMQGLADSFPALEVGGYGKSDDTSTGKLRTEIAGNGFIVAEDKEQEDTE